MKKPIKFSPEFRQAAVNRVLDGETQAEVAKSLGINSKTLHVWCRKAKESRSETANIKIDETARLRLELKKAKAEIEFLKKAAAYFTAVQDNLWYEDLKRIKNIIDF